MAIDVLEVIVSPSGHWVPEEQPEILARHLLSFLAGGPCQTSGAWGIAGVAGARSGQAPSGSRASELLLASSGTCSFREDAFPHPARAAGPPDDWPESPTANRSAAWFYTIDT